MKNLFARMTKLTLSLVAVFSLSSCGEDLITTDEQPVNPSEEKMTVFASVTDGTRTTIDANGIFRWQTVRVNNDDINDQIWIDKDGTGASFSLQSSSSEFYADNRMGKFYFRGSLGAPKYWLSYTGHGSTTGDEVTIAANQQQLGWDNASHIGTSGDCAVDTAFRDNATGNYSFTLQHKANYLIFQPYAPASTTSNPYRLSEIEILDTEGNVLAGTFPFTIDGLQANAGRDTHTKIVVSCSELNGEALTVPQSSSKSIYAVILPRGGADGGRALQVRYKVNTVSDGNFYVVQNISGNFEVNGARLIKHDLSVPAFPTVATFQSDGNGLFGGTRFKPGFLYRSNGNATTNATLQLVTDNPFILLHYNQRPWGNIVTVSEKRMFFSFNELVEIFGYAARGQGANWSTTSASAYATLTTPVTIGGKQYRMPSTSEYAKLIETPNAGRATVNYYPASFAAVKADLSADATYKTLGWQYEWNSNTMNADYIMGFLFFPDDAFILDAKIQVASLNGRWDTTYSTLTADDIRNYVSHGCLFIPAAGDIKSLSGFPAGNYCQNRGFYASYWSGSLINNVNYANRLAILPDRISVIEYARDVSHPVVLVEQ